jgi:hypothetical protein
MQEPEFHAHIFGSELRRYRKAMGWTARQLALVYSEEIGREDDLVNPTFIYHLEAGEMLVDKGRRAILARIVDMPLALAGISAVASQSAVKLFTTSLVDAKEYASTLEVYSATWQAGTTYKVAKDIRTRVNSLEKAALYATANRSELIDLLCGYQVLAADVVAEQNPGAAATLLGQTVDLAKQEGLHNFYVHALRQRAQTGISQFELTRDPAMLKQSFADFQATEQVQQSVSEFYQGLVNVRKGLVYAYTAPDKSKFTAALKVIDSAYHLVGQESDDPRIAARIDLERWRLNRASAFLYAPLGSPALALAELEELERDQPNTSPRRGVHRNILFSEAYLLLDNYPMSIAHAQAALEVTTSSYMDTLSSRLEGIYRTLRNSPYGTNPDTARFGVALLKAQRPELF